MRLHELAKEMEADSKELLALAKKLGLPVKSHSSNLAPGEIALLRVGYRYRDLDEDALFERLESEAEERQAEKAKEAEEKQRKADETRKRVAKAAEDAKARAAAAEELGAEAPHGAVAEPVLEGEAPLATASAVAEPSLAPAGEETLAEQKGAAAPADGAAEAEGGPEAPEERRGAKILGRIELDSKEVLKTEATHDQLERTIDKPGHGTGKTTEDRARRRRAVPKPVKWEPDPEEFAPVAAQDVAKPRFWERGPSRRQARRTGRRTAKVPNKGTVPDRKVTVATPVTVKDLSQTLGIRAADILGRLLMKEGRPFTVNSLLDEELILAVAMEFGREIEVQESRDAETVFLEKEEVTVEDSRAPLSGPDPRPPVVVFMGHVDHGKTSLLDYIRKTKVAAGEAGGITQHVSAYQVTTESGHAITFLDTPGHRAFTEMRARGANCTDIVVLVVAADDGVMPQTEEALQHARAASAEMPIVVALNKIDRPEAEPLRVKQQLMGLNLLPEEYGGKVGVIETSATTGRGVNELLERLALEAEIHELRADARHKARGYVLEASKLEGKGVVATVLVRDGTLRLRDPFLCGNTWGRVRIMEDDQGRPVKEAGPSRPVRVYGFKGEIPDAGDLFLAVDDERGAEKVAQERFQKVRAGQETVRETVTLENLFASLEAGKVHEICVVLKADVMGSLQVLERELEALQHEEVKVRVLRTGVGGISEEDIMLAGTSEAVVLGFGVSAEGKARRAAERLGVEIRTYDVIYELLDDLKKAMAGALSPDERERVVGHVEVRQVFKVSRVGSIAGCFVTDGVVRRSDHVRVLRDGKVIYTSTFDSLRRFKDDVREVKEGFECGIKIAGFDDIKVGDVFEVFEIVLEQRELSIQ